MSSRVVHLLLLTTLAVFAASADIKHIFSGVTPSNANWQSEGANTVSLTIDTRLGLTSTPTYLCRITSRYSSISKVSLFGSMEEDAFDPLANVTGNCTPRKPTAQGFKVRLRYAEGSNRNMTVAKASDFKVHWVAATNKFGNLGSKEFELERQAELIKQLIYEEPVMVKALLGLDYVAMQRNQPKPTPASKPTSSSKAKKNSTTTTTTEEDVKTTLEEESDVPEEEKDVNTANKTE